MSSKWDARFAREDYLFGTDPTVFLTDNAGLVPPEAQTLCVAEGEGRNAVWLASQGCRVTAFDSSLVAVDKARALAESRDVSVAFEIADIAAWNWQAHSYDLVVAVFIQFCPPDLRTKVFEGLKRALAPGGRLMLHGYTPEQVALGTGGPPDPNFMYTEGLLRQSFADLSILRCASYEKHLTEGSGHHGHSALIDLIADKPA